MFVETNKQQGIDNPIQGFAKSEKMRYQPLLLLFSLFVLITLFIETITGSTSFTAIQYVISYLFIGDFIYRLYVAKDKAKFLKASWIDLALCLPFYPPTWIFVTITLRSIKIILEYVLVEIKSAFKSMLVIGASLVTFSTISILQFETLPACNIKSVADAMWWSICTITTVGYGDKFPITDGGKIVAIILMISGIGLFGTLIGYISTFFTDKEKKDNDRIDTIEELSQQINELRKDLKNK